MEVPREVPDEEHERVWERVAAVDVAKGSGVVCTRVPDEDRPGRRRSHVWTVPARTGAITELGDHLRGLQAQVVTLESTSDYWRIWYVILEAAGLKVQLVNARTVKNVPGRAKTDKNDAVWLAKLTERGMLRPSFVPPPEIRRLRELIRLRADLVHDRTRHWARMEKLLERALIKISDVMSELNCVSGRAMIEALIAGQRGPGSWRTGQGPAAQEASRPGRGAGRPVRGPPRRDRPDPAGPDRQPHCPDRGPDRPDRRADRRDPRCLGRGRRRHRTLVYHAPDAAVLPAVARLIITGCGPYAAQAVIAEIGLT